MEQQAWNEKASMMVALPGKGAHEVSDLTTVDLSGPSPSHQLLVVFRDGTDLSVLVCKDMDSRKLENGSYRPTRGTYKATVGWGGDKHNLFADGSPIDISLASTLPSRREKLEFMGFAYVERGEGWGPVCVLPHLFTGSKKDKEQWLEDLNENQENQRFQGFRTLPLELMASSGHGEGAVYDANKLVRVQDPSSDNGEKLTLWDEAQMRSLLLPKLRKNE